MKRRRLRSTLGLLILLSIWLPGSLVSRVQAYSPFAVSTTPAVALATSRAGNFFAPDQPVTVSVTLTNPSNTPRTVLLTESVQDFTGAATLLFTGTVTLPGAAPQSSMVTLPTHGLGYYELDVTLTDPGTGQQLASGQISAGVMPTQTLAPNLKSPFGVAGNLLQAYANDTQKLGIAAAEIAAAGIQYVREEFNWQQAQKIPGNGAFNFTQQDKAVIAAHNAGLTILGLMDYWNTLPQPDITVMMSGTDTLNVVTGCSKAPACAYTPQGDALFAQFAAALVTRYRPGGDLARQQGWNDGYGISTWEVWNEPSTQSFWRHDLKGYQSLFARMYVAASTAIRQADPTAQIMYDESGQAFDQALAVSNAGHDILAIHSYTGGLDPDTSLASPTLPRGGQGTAPAAIGQFVAQGKPVWITETGYTTDGTVTNRQQADYLVREFVNFLAAGVSKEFWFKFREDAAGGDNLYGLVHQDFSPKPAYLAYSTLTHQLAGTMFARQVQLGSAVRAFLFTSTEGTTAVLYSVGESGSMSIPLNGVQAVAHDLMGNVLIQQGAGTMTVPLSGDPVFVTFQNTQPLAIAAALQAAQIGQINPIGVGVQLSPGLVNGLPNVNVTVTARTNVPISGTVQLQLPAGWSVQALTQRFRTLQPGQSSTLTTRLLSEVSHSGDALTALATSSAGLTATTTSPVLTYALSYGHPQIDGTLATWGTASALDLTTLRPDQVVGIPGWTPQNISARVYTMWDQKYFYLATSVHDQTFDYAPIGYNMYQGDSIQYGWGMDPAAWNSDSGTNRYNVTAGLTHQGSANFQYNLLGPWDDMLVQIKPDPATGDTIYTTAIPWSRLGGYTPRVGNHFAFDLLINQNEHHSRIGWIQISPGMGIGFYPSEFPLWSIIPNNPAAGLRVTNGGQQSLAVTLPVAHGSLVIHDGGMRQLSLTVNGTALTLIAGKDYRSFTASSIDLSQYLHAGDNTVVATGLSSNRLSAAVLSFFQ